VLGLVHNPSLSKAAGLCKGKSSNSVCYYKRCNSLWTVIGNLPSVRRYESEKQLRNKAKYMLTGHRQSHNEALHKLQYSTNNIVR
jgi:hypothetical protein